MSAFYEVPSNIMDTVQFNAGLLLWNFNILDGGYAEYEKSDIIGATNGGITINIVPNYVDLAEGVDNCNSNTAQLKRLNNWDVSVTGTLVSFDDRAARLLLNHSQAGTGAAASGYAPARNLSFKKDSSTGLNTTASSFRDIWWVGQQGSDESINFIAVNLRNVLATSGLSFKTNDKGKGEVGFTLTAHYDADLANELGISAPVKFYMSKFSTFTPLVATSDSSSSSSGSSSSGG